MKNKKQYHFSSLRKESNILYMNLNRDSFLVEFVNTYNPIRKESNSMDLNGDSFVVEFVITYLIKEIWIKNFSVEA